MCGNILGMPQASSTKAPPSPTKTDADVAQSAEVERRRLAYSQFGLESLFGSSNQDDQPVKKITLGV